MRSSKNWRFSLTVLFIGLGLFSGCSGDDSTPTKDAGAGGRDGGSAGGGGSAVGGAKIDGGTGGKADAGTGGNVDASAGGAAGTGGAGGGTSATGGTTAVDGSPGDGSQVDGSQGDGSPGVDGAVDGGRDVGVDAAPDGSDDAAEASTRTALCTFDYTDAGAAPFWPGVCDYRPGAAGGVVVPSSDGVAGGAAEFTPTWSTTTTSVQRIRWYSNTQPTNWSSYSKVHVAVKVLNAGLMQKLEPCIQCTGAPTYLPGTAYLPADLPPNTWTDVVFDLSTVHESCNLSNVISFGVQLTPVNPITQTDGGYDEPQILIDNLDVE